jgi:hypothetical protein
MNMFLGLVVAVALFGSGVWANIEGSGMLSQSRGAWVSHIVR